MSQPSPFSTRTVLILVIGGALLMLSAILLSGFGDEVSRVVGDAPAADRRDGAGYHAFQRLVDAVQPAAADDGDPIGTPGILILTPTGTTGPQAVKAIIDHRIELADMANEETEGTPDRYPTLLILPKWEVAKIPLGGGRVERTGPVGSFRTLPLIPASVEGHGEEVGDTGPMADTAYAGLRPFAMPDRLVDAVKGETITPLIGARDGAAVLGQIGSSDTFVLADADTVNNRALADVRNARAALAMLRAIDPEHGGRARFDRTLHYAAGNRNLVKLLFLPPFLGVTLALIVAAILAGIATARRFGPPARERRAVPPGKRALVDNIVSLTRLAGRTRHAGPRYADLMIETIARSLALGGADAATLERVHPGYRDIDRRLRAARTEPEALAAARALHAWKKEAGA
ncbi:hypothetical protein [Sphingomonas sp. Leaf25]|uniref:hypothetical protein n=1 Tax=Sphingomonas sp. Leaf25 TaxID=1735692 RepID=UPI0006FE192D|nr:hypothetical protein [Sphingomonas sp. Leaf25]KQM97544.1 hypothetical protein ASE78_09125 [Sphingomonas sp. Leaf25]